MKKLKINAVYVKDLSQIVRNPRLPFAIGIFLTILSVLGIAALTGIFSGQDRFTSLRNSFIILYKILLGFEFVLLIFMMPELTASSISSERENKTLDLMLVTTMNPYSIVIGKLLSALTKIMLYAVASLPVIGLVYVIGVIDFSSIRSFFLILMVSSFYVGSYGMLMSVLFQKSSTATIITYCSILIVIGGSIFAVFLDEIFGGKKGYLDLFDFFLLFNPIATIYVMMSEQLGMIGNGLELILAETQEEHFVLKHWLVFSLSAQVILGSINVYLAGHFLNPLRKK